MIILCEERQTSYDITYMWNLKKWYKWTYLHILLSFMSRTGWWLTFKVMGRLWTDWYPSPMIWRLMEYWGQDIVPDKGCACMLRGMEGEWCWESSIHTGRYACHPHPVACPERLSCMDSINRVPACMVLLGFGQWGALPRRSERGWREHDLRVFILLVFSLWCFLGWQGLSSKGNAYHDPFSMGPSPLGSGNLLPLLPVGFWAVKISSIMITCCFFAVPL